MYVNKLSPEKIKALKEQIEGLSSQIILIYVKSERFMLIYSMKLLL